MMRSLRSFIEVIRMGGWAENLTRIVVILGSLVVAMGTLWCIVRNIPTNVGLFLW